MLGRGIREGVRRIFRLGVYRPEVIRDDVDDELRAFLDARIEYLTERGMAPDAARAEALRRLGDSLEATRRRLHYSAHQRERRMHWRERFDNLRQDLRYALRGMRLQPGFTAAIVLILALGIGANAAMFQIVDRLLFRVPTYLRTPGLTHQLYFGQAYQGKEFQSSNVQYTRYLDLRKMTHSFAHLAAFFESKEPIGVGQDARQMQISAVSASLFAFFDARPEIGRFFTASEDSVPTGTDVAVLSDAYWTTKYDRDPKVLGQTMQIGPLIFTIIGVAPPDFTGMSPNTPVAFIPITAFAYSMVGRDGNKEYYTKYNMRWAEIIAERKPEVTVASATADFTQAFRRSYELQLAMGRGSAPMDVARPRGIIASVVKERGPRQGEDSKVATWLVGVAAIVLLIACANVANLLLARALRRRREIAVRLALGVGRGRLLGQLLTESAALALLGALGGLLIAQWGGSYLRTEFLSRRDPQGIFADGRTILFTAAVAVLVGLLTGLAPALHALRSNVAGALKAGTREGSYHKSPIRVGLLVLQGALSVILLVGAGLFIRSLSHVDAIPLGYAADELLYVSPEMRGVKLDSAAKVALGEALLARARSVPGVVAASRISTVPFYMEWDSQIYVPGLDTAEINKMGSFPIQSGSPSFFETVGTRLLRGRGLTATDRDGAPLVMVVSEPMARALWKGRDALGQCVKVDADTMPCTTVVGVAERTQTSDFREDPGFMYYRPAEQIDPETAMLFVRTRGNAAPMADRVRRAVQAEMPGISYVTVTPMADRVAPEVRSWKLGATMFTLFGALALVLAAFGLYSVIAYNVVQRQHELGVRVALGAQANNVLRLVLGDGMRVALVGVGISLWAVRWIEPLLFKEPARDPAVFITVAVVLLGAAALASLFPALRATRVDPASVLRSD
jgi:putative ABC transport system permease protein